MLSCYHVIMLSWCYHVIIMLSCYLLSCYHVICYHVIMLSLVIMDLYFNIYVTFCHILYVSWVWSLSGVVVCRSGVHHNRIDGRVPSCCAMEKDVDFDRLYCDISRWPSLPHSGSPINFVFSRIDTCFVCSPATLLSHFPAPSALMFCAKIVEFWVHRLFGDHRHPHLINSSSTHECTTQNFIGSTRSLLFYPCFLGPG